MAKLRTNRERLVRQSVTGDAAHPRFGMMVYRIYRGATDLGTRVLFFAAVAVYGAGHAAIETAIVIGLLALFCLAVFVDVEPRRVRPLVFLGTISYPLYLVHQSLGHIAIQALGTAGAGPHASIGGALFLVMLMAWGLTYFVERPTLTWLRGRWPSAAVTGIPVAPLA